MQQLIKSGQTFGGGSTLIGLESDMELSKGEKEKDFWQALFQSRLQSEHSGCSCYF